MPLKTEFDAIKDEVVNDLDLIRGLFAFDAEGVKRPELLTVTCSSTLRERVTEFPEDARFIQMATVRHDHREYSLSGTRRVYGFRDDRWGHRARALITRFVEGTRHYQLDTATGSYAPFSLVDPEGTVNDANTRANIAMEMAVRRAFGIPYNFSA